MADIVTPYTGVAPSRSLSSAAFDSAMDEFVPFVTGLPADINAAISYIVGLADAKWYSATTTYNETGSTSPSFVYGSDGVTYVCIGTDVLADNPVGSVTGNWAAITALDAGSSSSGEVGSYLPIAGGTVPDDYLEADGSAVSRTVYADLYAVIGTMYGVGDGSTTFNLPDARGEFFRGYDHGAGNDPDAASRTDRGDGTTGDNVGTKQPWQIQGHTHSSSLYWYDFQIGSSQSAATSATGGPSAWGTGSTGGNQTNPTNISVMWCIKY